MQTKRLSILSFGPQPVFPATDGGKEGIYGALQALAKQCDIIYAFPAGGAEVNTEGYALAGIEALPVHWSAQEDIGLILSSLCRLKPYKFDKYSCKAAIDTFAAALRGRTVDAILCFHAHTARLGQGVAAVLGVDVPVLVREHNIEYELVASYRRSLGPVKRLAALPFELVTRREEQRIWQDAAAIAFLSDQDLATARSSCSSGRFVLAREGVPIPARREIHHPGPDAPLLILLNPKAAQSVANLKEFLYRYWADAVSDPRLAGTFLQVTGVSTVQLASLVGIEASRLNDLRVQGLGFVDDLSSVFSAALALVSPTFVGGGIRKKVLEAMAHQVPVIATRFDINVCSYFSAGTNILDMQDKESFCVSVARLKSEPAFWNQLAQAGRLTVEEHANWDQCATTIVQKMNELLASRQGVTKN